MQLSRRGLVQAGAMAAAAFPMIARSEVALAAGGRTWSRRAIDVVGGALVIDMLAPLKITLRPDYFATTLSDAEKAEFRTSGITAFHHSYGLGGPDAFPDALEYLAGWQGFVGRHADLFTLVGEAADLDRAKAAGKCAVIMGIQNADHFRTAADVGRFHKLGLRCSQLTYNSQNFLGSGSTERVDGGVADYGAEIIAEMEKVGMLVDVSHCGERTTLDGIALAKGPIAITHGNCRALVDHPRNKTDEAIRALAAKGGVMGITGVRMFVKKTDPTTVADMADHIEHVAKLVGIEHVGIG